MNRFFDGGNDMDYSEQANGVRCNTSDSDNDLECSGLTVKKVEWCKDDYNPRREAFKRRMIIFKEGMY